MSNIINLTWNGATDDSGIAGYELQWRLSTNTPWSLPILVSHNPNGVNTSTYGGGSYSHIATQLVDHYFRIRIVDNVGQYSDYKEILATVDTSVILISAVSSNNNSSNVCILNLFNPVNPIILLNNNVTPTTSITPNVTYVKNADNTVFNGFNRFWRILLPTPSSYNCKIEPDGKITQIEICGYSIRSEKISIGYSSNTTSSFICDAGLDYDIYYNGSLLIGTIIYNVLDGTTLSSPFTGANKYYLISEGLLSTYIVKILNNGKVDSIQDYSVVCPITTINNNCCFVKGTKITMSDYTNKNIEDVKIGEIVITYNEETKEQEPGEVINTAKPLRSDIVEYKLSNDVIIKSTSCHPYWVINKGWSSFSPLLTKELYEFDVEKIEENDILLTIDNKEVIVDKITELITKEVSTYNLRILGNHTYYANGILVHNKDLITLSTCYLP